MARTASTVSVNLGELNRALGDNPNLKVTVSRKWAEAAEAFLGVTLATNETPEKPDVDEPKAAAAPTIGEH